MPVDGVGVTLYCNSALILKYAYLPVDGVGVTVYCKCALILIRFQARRYGRANYANNNTGADHFSQKAIILIGRRGSCFRSHDRQLVTLVEDTKSMDHIWPSPSYDILEIVATRSHIDMET